MKKSIELEFEAFGESRGYYIFRLKAAEQPVQIYPQKIYLRKDLFEKPVRTIRIIINGEQEVYGMFWKIIIYKLVKAIPLNKKEKKTVKEIIKLMEG